MLFAIGLAIVAAFAADRTWTRGNGMVAGELTAHANDLKDVINRLALIVGRNKAIPLMVKPKTVKPKFIHMDSLSNQVPVRPGAFPLDEDFKEF